MRKVILVLIFNLIFLLVLLSLKNVSGKMSQAYLAYFSAPNTSKINESGINKTVITKKQMIDLAMRMLEVYLNMLWS